MVAYVREGLLDPEIAVRLGIPIGEVKRRIEAAIGKLGLPDRAALREGTPTPPGSVFAEPSPVDPLPGSAPADGTRRRHVATLVGLLLAVSAVVAATVYLATRGGTAGDPSAGLREGDTPVPAESTPGPYDVRTEIAGIAVDELLERPPVDLVENLVVYLSPGCPGCADDGALTRLSRIGGAVRHELLFRPAEGRLWGVHIDPDGYRMLATVCVAGPCGNPTAASPERVFTLYASDDGGITWRTVLTAEGPTLMPWRILGETAVVYRGPEDAEAPAGTVQLREGTVRWGPIPPGLAAIPEPPVPAGLEDATLRWTTTSVASATGVLFWAYGPAGDAITSYVGASRDGRLVSAFVGPDEGWNPFVALGDGAVVVVRPEGDYALLDAIDGTVTPLTALGAAHPVTPPYPVAGFLKPMARIAAPGSCAAFEPAANDGGPPPPCLPDGLLVRPGAGFRAARDGRGGRDVLVILPDGRTGWVDEAQVQLPVTAP